MKGQDPQELIFWIIVGALIAAFFILFANQLVFGYLKVTNVVKP